MAPIKARLDAVWVPSTVSPDVATYRTGRFWGQISHGKAFPDTGVLVWRAEVGTVVIISRRTFDTEVAAKAWVESWVAFNAGQDVN